MQMQRLSIFLIISASTLILTHLLIRFERSKDPADSSLANRNNVGYFVNLGFSAFQVESDRRQEIALLHKYQVTAILLHWKRLSAVQQKINHFVDSRLFSQIILWNNNPAINLTFAHLNLHNTSASSLIRIINSPYNLKDQAKYRACSLASTSACFYSDDDWDTSIYINTLLASFRADPTVLHTVTEPYTFYTNLVWTYFDTTIGLHAGFTWIGCGSVFLRAHAQRHLQLLDQYLIGNESLTALSDVFFSVWLNDIPAQMNTDIKELVTKGIGAFPFSSTGGFLQMQRRSAITAIRLLEHSLRVNRSSNGTLSFPRNSCRRMPYLVKSPGLHDDLTFYTNVLPLDIAQIPFNITRDFAKGTRNNLPYGDSVKHFLAHSTLHAVDRDPVTCWSPRDAVRSGDYFAIDFLRIQSNVTFSLTVGHDQSLQASLEVRVSLNGRWWIPYRSLHGISVETNVSGRKYLSKITYDGSQFTLGFRWFRYVMFKSNDPWKVPFRVCDVTIIQRSSPLSG